MNTNKFDILKLKGKPGKIRDWMSNKLPPKASFYLLGIMSTIWFLLRVLPKPSRATYPCMRVAAPFMSGFVIYLLSLGGITLAILKARQNIVRAKYIAAASFVLVALLGISFTLVQHSQNTYASGIVPTGPEDGPNQPIGEAVGIHPGRVIWAWDPKATNDISTGSYYKEEYNNQKVISKMFSESVKKLAGEENIAASWDALFRSFNSRKNLVEKAYTPGEKIFIKINQTSGRGSLKEAARKEGNYDTPEHSSRRKGRHIGTCQTTPYLALALLRHLVNECGIAQSDIAIGDPQNPTFGHNYKAWSAEFPDVVYTDRTFGTFGRTLIHPTKDELLIYSDKTQTDKLYDIIENADYMINLANLKPHSLAGITLTAKNHFGSHSRKMARHLHYSHVVPVVRGIASNTGYKKYRVMVDLMGSKYLGQNTLLFIIDGLFGGGSTEGGPPVKYFMAPFNNDWSNSILISEDQVALESVCYDILRTEWNGIHKHDRSNNSYESIPNVNGVDDYLHQAADKSNWPEGITYDPDNSGTPIPSLGIHEHWDDAGRKQYSRNLGKPYGIELISIPSKITGPRAARMASRHKNRKSVPKGSSVPVAVSSINQSETEENSMLKNTDHYGSKFESVSRLPIARELSGKSFYAGFVDVNDEKWFLTDIGIVKIAAARFQIASKNSKIPIENLKSFAYQSTKSGSKISIGSNEGVFIANQPFDPGSDIIEINSGNSPLPSDSVLSVVSGRNDMNWFGTHKGISAKFEDIWLTPSYDDEYPEGFFEYYPITTMAASEDGDSLYVATLGAGIGRMYRNDVDGISGASPYAKWGPCLLPSDNIHSICIQGNTQWYGTDAGLASHDGNDYMENWTAYTNENGLVDNFVQALAVDSFGKLWVGTKGGISVFDGSIWTNYTLQDGLTSNNILCIVCDKHGSVYLGTDNGLMIYTNGELICFQ
jgi:hypothetical protein